MAGKIKHAFLKKEIKTVHYKNIIYNQNKDKHMKHTSFAQKVLFGVEIVLSLRLLLFVAPALMIQSSSSGKAISEFSDWYLVALLIIAMLYGLVGLAALIRHRLWLLFHLLAALITGGLAVALLQLAQSTGVPQIHVGYWLPFGLCLIFTVAAFTLNSDSK